jgi:hypothetical protein
MCVYKNKSTWKASTKRDERNLGVIFNSSTFWPKLLINF